LLDDRPETPTPGLVAAVGEQVGALTVHCGETARDDWLAVPDQPYAPASPSKEGFIHCSPDEAVTLPSPTPLPRHPGPVMALLIDEHKLDAIL
jgi:hypothetical protein